MELMLLKNGDSFYLYCFCSRTEAVFFYYKLGHSNIKTTTIYLMASAEHL